MPCSDKAPPDYESHMPSLLRLYRNTAAYPQSAAHAEGRVLYQPQRRCVIGFIRLPHSNDPNTARTHVRLPYGKSLGIRIVRDSDQIPYTAAGIAEAGEHTEILIVGQFEFRPSERFGPLEQPLRGRRSDAGPTPHAYERTVAVRLLLRCPTATQGRRLVVGRVMLSFGELPTLPGRSA